MTPNQSDTWALKPWVIFAKFLLVAAFLVVVNFGFESRGRLLVHSAPEAVIAQAPLDIAAPRAPQSLEDAYLRWIASGRRAETVAEAAGA